MTCYIPYSLQFYIIHGPDEGPKRNSYTAACYLMFHAAFTIIAHSTSIWLTVCVPLFRFIHLSMRDGKTYCSLGRANLSILIVLVGAIIMNIPQLTVLKLDRWDSDTNESWYYLNQRRDKPNVILAQYIIMALLIKIGPSVLLIILSLLLVRIIMIAHRKYKAMRGKQTGSNHTKSQFEYKREKQTQQTTKMLIAVAVVFTMAELPQGILFVLAYMLADFYDRIYWPLGNFVDLLTLISCCINFVLYYTMSTPFRRALSASLSERAPRLVLLWRNRRKMSDVENGQTQQKVNEEKPFLSPVPRETDTVE